MREYLKISNFGPIVTVELNDIRPLTILIGESGSGKSTIMKVLSLFRWLYKRENLRSFLQESGIKQTTIRTRVKTLLKISGIDEFLKPNTEIIYRRGNYEIAIRKGKLSRGSRIRKEDLSLEKICFISDKRSIISDFLNHRLDKRIANYYLKDTIDNFLLASKYIKSLDIDYLGIKLKIDKVNGVETYRVYGIGETENFKINIQNASSGMQTVLPLSMIVEYYAKYFDPVAAMNSSLLEYMADSDSLHDFKPIQNIGNITEQNIHLQIEEPELSLYSESQLQLMDFLVRRCFDDNHSYNMTLMLATHSPYIVNYLNLLIRRARFNNTDNPSIDFQNIDAYEIIAGEAFSLRIENEQLINAISLSTPISNIYRDFNNIN